MSSSPWQAGPDTRLLVVPYRHAGLPTPNLGGGLMTRKITRDILESYLNCKYKAHLKLAGQQGNKSDYEGLLVASRQEVRQEAIGKILSLHPGDEVARDIVLSA